MRLSTITLSTLLATSALASAPGQPGGPVAGMPNLSPHGAAPIGFEENKGQVRTMEGEPAPYVRYRLSQGNTQIFLLGNGIAYQFSRLHYSPSSQEGVAATRNDREGTKQMAPMCDQVRLETFRMDMELEGADPDARITTEGRNEDYTHYYNHGALDVHSYSKVTYHEIYPGIDWVIYTTEKGMKYDFVVRPGADPDRIRMRFKHHEVLFLDADGNLIHGNRMGRFTEERPVSFQDGKEVRTSFVLEGSTLRFALENYDRNQTLTIDPDRIWGTYYGGAAQDIGWSCDFDASGNVFLAGSTASATAIASGGHQNTIGGDVDAFLIKFTSTGTRLWGTYYGGVGNDVGYQCAVDASGSVFLAGSTEAATGIASGGHQGTFGGDVDAFLVKFNASGTRLWGTYYGDTGYDRGLGCEVDAGGNVYLCGETSSISAMASGGHQNAYGGGDIDAFLAKFSPTGTRLWGTYYGGSAFDASYSCVVDAGGNVLLCGKTGSTSSIASGGHQNAFGGGLGDAFLAKFSSGGTRLWGSYYGGPDDDYGWSCSVSPFGDVFLAGSTTSTTAIASGGFQNAYGGGTRDAYIAKFNENGTRIWGSYYGGSVEDFGFSCAVDASGNSYLAGWTTSTVGIASNGYQNTYGGGGTDAFLVKLYPSGERAWGTYYGGAGDEGGFWDETYFAIGRCVVNPSGDVLLTGHTTSTTGISENGFQNTFGGDRDAYLVKFADRSITTGVINGPLCTGQAVSVPFTVSGAFNAGNTFTAQLSNASGSFASPVNIGNLSGTTSGSITASIPLGTAPGSGYRIRVVGSNPIVIGTDNGTNLTINDRTTNCTCADVVETEANNTAATANAIAYDTPVSGITGPCSLPDNTVDHFSFTTTTQGVLHVEACLSTTGPTAFDVTFRVLNGTGTTLGTFTLPAGANNIPMPGEFDFLCLGIGSHRIAVDNPSTTHCTNYAFSYTILPPVFANDPEPNDGLGVSATQLAYDTDQDGRINFDGESTYDYYRILLPTNGVLNIDLQAEHAGGTPGTMTVALLTTGGSEIQSWPVTVGASGVPVSSALSIICRSTVNYYHIRISSAVCGASYRLKYTVSPPVFGADTEPNNGAPGTPVAHDTYTDGHLQFDGESTYDYFNIVPPTSGVMSIEVQAEHVGGSAGTMEMALCNSAGTAIQTWTVDVGANSTPTTTTVSIPCRSGTTNYNVRISSTTCGVSYRWKYEMTPPLFTNDVETNNAVNGSIEDYDTWYEGQVGFDNQTDDDIFTIDPPNSGIMHISVEAEHTGASPGTVTVALLNAAGTVIQSWDMVAGANGVMEDSLVSVICRSGAVNYNLRFSDVTCGVSYRWKYTMTAPHFANDVEPNNSAPGNSLAHDTFTEGQVQFDGDTYDYYTITPPTNGVMHFELEAEHVGTSTGAIELALLNSAGTVIQTWALNVGANSAPMDTAFSITCRSTVNPYRVRIASSTCGVSYRFKYAMTAPLFAVDAEPNNTQPGTALAANTYTEGQINFDAENIYDIYRIVPAANGMVNVELQAEHTGATQGTMTVVLLSTGGTTLQTWSFPIGANSVPLTATLSKTCLTGGTAYDLRLSSSVCGASYRMRYTLTTPVYTNDAEPNNTTAQAPVLADGQFVQGHVNDPAGDNVDIYRVNTPSQGRLNLQIEAEHAGPETNATVTVQLLNSSGGVLQTWTGPVGAASVPLTTQITRTCTGFATYYLRVSSSICLTSYRLTQSLTWPSFANDTEPNQLLGETVAIPPSTNIDGHLTFEYDNNFDGYRIYPATDGVITVTVHAVQAGPVTTDSMWVEMKNSSNQSLVIWKARVGANGVPYTSTFTYRCAGTESFYYIWTASFPSTCGIAYRLNYTITPPYFGDDVEPNDGLAQTIITQADTAYDGRIAFNYDGTFDGYRIYPTADGVLTLTVMAEHAQAVPGTMYVELKSNGNTSIALWPVSVGANGTPDTTVITYKCLGSTNFYYLFAGLPSGCGVSYRFSYTLTPALFGTDPEPNSNLSNTRITQANTPYDGHLNFDYDGSTDGNRIYAPNNGVLELTFIAEHAGSTQDSLNIYLNNNGSGGVTNWRVPIGNNSTPDTTVLIVRCIGDDSYYHLWIQNSSACGVSYRFSYTLIAPVFSEDPEPNSNLSNTRITQADTWYDGQLNFYYDGSTDGNRIFAPNNGVLELTFIAEHAGSTQDSLNIYLNNSSSGGVTSWRVPIGSNSTPDTTVLTLPCIGDDALYYLWIQNSSACGVSYRFSYTVLAPVFGDDPEPNSNHSNARITQADTPYDGQLNFYYDGASDGHKLYAPNDGVLTFTIMAEHAGATTQDSLTIYFENSSAGNIGIWRVPIGSNSVPATSTFTHHCTGTESFYYAWIQNASACGVSYRFSYSVAVPVFADDVEPNNSSSQAPLVDLNTAPVDGHVGFNYDNAWDVFKINHPGGVLRVITSAEKAGAPGVSTFYIRNSGYAAIVTNSTLAVGGYGLPAIDTTETATSVPAGVYYLEMNSWALCGVSYRIHCYDDDNDGTCNANDVCAGGPEPGTPCDDGNPATINDVITGGCNCAGTSATVSVPVRVMLEGPYDADNGLMGDALRSLPAFPLTDPYPGLGYAHVGGGNSGSVSPAVLAVSGNDAIVDWVVIELRNMVAPATVVASRSALVQRDGDVLEPDGLTPVAFSVSSGMYHVAVRHRNHLGAMTKDPVMVSAGTTLLDFSSPAFETYGSQARTAIAGSFPAEALWSGDVSFDGELKYVGENNDRDPILVLIGGSVPTNVVSGVYSTADCNLDGSVMYVGDGNDRDPILVNIGGSVPTNTRQEQLP